MSQETFIWVVVATMGVSNLIIRFVPVSIVSRLHLPPPVERWLSFVPVSVLATIVASEVLRPGGTTPVPWDNPYLLAAFPTAFVYHRTRDYVWATVAGILSFLAIRALLG